MSRASHHAVLGVLLSLAVSACTAAADGGREPTGASGGAAIANLASTRATTTDGGQGGPPSSGGAEAVRVPGAAAERAEDPADLTVGAAGPEPAGSPGHERPARPRQLLYRRLP